MFAATDTGYSAQMFTHHNAVPYDPADFAAMRVPEMWAKYDSLLTWGKGQTLAILDDGCNMAEPRWNTSLPWGRKVVATWNSIDGNEDPAPGPIGYHGTTVGYPSSLNADGVIGVAYNNFVAHVRSVSIVHLTQDESPTMAAALRWVHENSQRYNITAVNFAMLDDKPHTAPRESEIDGPLQSLRQAGVWVSAPCGNNEFTNGISWPACQPHCFAIGATKAETGEVHRDRWRNTDLLAPATATSSSNAYVCAASMILREAITKTNYHWQDDGPNLPEAIMTIFKRTGVATNDPATGLVFRRLDLLAAVDHVFAGYK